MAAPKFEMEKFNGNNDFGLWRLKMKAVMMQQGLWEILKGGKDDQEDKMDLKNSELQDKAYSTLILSLSDRVLREVSRLETAAEIWNKLESLYMTKSLTNRLYLKQKLFTFRFVDSKGIKEQLEDFAKCIDDLENIDEVVKDEDKALMLLNSLPRSFDQFKDAILLGRDSKITYEEVYSALKMKDSQRIVAKSTDPAAEAMNIRPADKKWNKKKGQKKWKSGKDKEEKETRSCHYCKKPGHLKKNCYAWKKKQEEADKSLNTADLAQEVENAEVMNVMEGDITESWIMDSGCSFHLCPKMEWFQDLQEANGSVLLGNNQACMVKGIGSVKFKLPDGSIKIITEVRYIPDIKRNLISLGALERKGFSFLSKDGKMKIFKGSRLVMEAIRKNSLYYLLGEVVLGQVNAVGKLEVSLWHLRLGHVSQGGVKQLVKQGVIQESADVSSKECEVCVLGKSRKSPFPTGRHTSTQPMQYAHSDVWGPASVPTVGGGRYFISIIDDFSRKLWIFVMKEKSEAFDKFRIWCKETEVEKGLSLKCLRTDNGLEFLSHKFDEFCKLRGIKRHRTVPNNPQQNGVAERANRTILERVRCMLISSGMSKRFWGEAASTAAVLINKCPSSAIEMDTPDFRWYGSYGSYTMLKPFGCLAYSHIKQGKLEPRAIKCVMLGYQRGVKGYRLWSLESGNQKVVVSRDVTFRELEMPYKASEKSDVAGEKTTFEVELLDNTKIDYEQIVDTNSDEDEMVHDDSVGPSAEVDEDLSDYLLARDRRRRENVKRPARYSNAGLVHYALCVAEEVESSEPSTYKEAMRSRERDKWIKAMQEEIDSLIRNKTWILVTKSVMQRIIGCKWIYKRKIEASDNDRVRYKARLVAKGYNQREGIDYNEIFSPVVKHSSIRMLLALTAKYDWELHQLDVKTAFLNGELEESIYMEQPEGFIKPGDEGKVCLLKRSLYGLKQASRQWNKQFNLHMLQIGFENSKYDSCVYFKKKDGKAVAYLLLYVDDMLVAGSDMNEIQKVKHDLSNRFEMKDLGEAKRILGIDIFRDRRKRVLWLSQQGYIDKLLKKFQMDESRTVATPLGQQFKLSVENRPKNDEERKEMAKIPYANIIGSVMYVMVCTRPDIAHAVSLTSRYMSDPGRVHWQALKWILRYLRGSNDYGIMFSGDQDHTKDVLQGFCDSDFAANLDSRKSQTGYIFTLFGTAISWKSNLQSVVALSTTEAEYNALADAVKESYWLKGLLSDFGVNQRKVVIHCDSSSAICLTKHQTFHNRSKHMDVRLHFVRDEVSKGEVEVKKIGTEHNPADALTKSLPANKFTYCLELVKVQRK